VAWFVTNCNDRNGRRQYAQELQKYIPVDIYGACGTKKCPRSTENVCFDMLDTDYKFYLAFENSNCRDYITEKLFLNALR
jgi:glycoprotein 3-alpha-L-fucosyltransferase